MNRLPSSVSRPLIRAAYCLPLIFGILLLIWACIPHIFFVNNHLPTKETHNLFGLMANTWRECSALLDGATTGSTNAVYFSYAMNFSVVLSWLCIIWYAASAIAMAIFSTQAFSTPPTSREANRAKRFLQLLVPNRIVYALVLLMPLFPAVFAEILAYCYRTQLNLPITAAYIGPTDWSGTAIAVGVQLLLWLALLPAQAHEHMDMYRLYKAKK